MAEGEPQRASDVLGPLVACCIALLVLDTFFFILRYFTRCVIKPIPLGPDDLLLFLSYIINVGICVVGLMMVHIESKGNPLADVQMAGSLDQIENQLKPALKCIFAISQLHFSGFTAPKLSLLVLYLRVFVGKPFRIATWIVFGIVLCAGLSYMLTDIFSCQPIHYFWDKTIHGKCIAFDPFYRWLNGINVMIDLAILALPLYPLWQLRAPRAKKLGLTFIFMLAGLGLVMCIVRWVQFLRYSGEIIDPHNTERLIIWVAVEPSVYLIACCLAGCGPLFTASKRFTSRKSTFPSEPYDSESHRTRSAGYSGFSQLHESGSESNTLVRPKAAHYTPTASATDDPYELEVIQE